MPPLALQIPAMGGAGPGSLLTLRMIDRAGEKGHRLSLVIRNVNTPVTNTGSSSIFSNLEIL